MSEKIMLPTPQQVCAQEWNKLITNQIQNALGARLQEKFTAANYPAGFNYDVKETFYNDDSLAALNSLVSESDGIPVINGVYTTLYKRVIGNLEYGISKKDRDTINKEQSEQQSLAGTIIDLYGSSGLDSEKQKYPDILYIMKRIKEVTGEDYAHVDMGAYPNLAPLCGKLSEYTRLAKTTLRLQNQWIAASDRLEAIQEHIESPSDDNGGLRTNAGKISVGWEQLPETEQLLDALKDTNSSVSISIKTDSFSEGESDVHFDSTVNARIPFNWFFNLNVEHEHSYDFSKYTAEDSKMDISITFNGITTLAVVPSPLSDNNNTGWFAKDILDDAAAKSGKDATGYQLHGSEFDPASLFGKNGKLRRMKTLVISQQPVISLTFTKFNYEEMQEIFTQETDVEFSILGGIISGSHHNEYSVSDRSYDAEKQELKVTINPPEIDSQGSIGKQTAYVLGGVVEAIEADSKAEGFAEYGFNIK